MIAVLLVAAACHPGLVADRTCTPGATFVATRRQVCTSGWASAHRHVTTAQRHRIFARYGIPYERHKLYELDHLIPLELGGSNADANLWPEPLKPSDLGAFAKDRMEDDLHRLVCAGKERLRAAQQEVVGLWSKP